MLAFDTTWPADSIEFCPTEGFRDIFACGTYKLDERPLREAHSSSTPAQKRKGQGLIFHSRIDTNGMPSCERVQTIDLPAIPDMKWCHGTSTPTLCIADSEGSITLYGWREDSFHLLDSIRCAHIDTLCLSLDWSDRRTGGQTIGSLIVSLSNGSLCLLKPQEGANLGIADTWHAHDYEPWVASWNYWDTNVIYSGGDDLKLKAWDVRQGFEQPTFINKRFDAGVTTIQSHPHIEHFIAVGSYNNTVYLFDVRKPLVPVTQTEVGGGAWRVKWHPSASRKHDLLVACMHDGFKVVRLEGCRDTDHDYLFSGGAQIIQEFKLHDSLAYGVDWSYEPVLEKGETIIGSCSFYDHKICIWSG